MMHVINYSFGKANQHFLQLMSQRLTKLRVHDQAIIIIDH